MKIGSEEIKYKPEAKKSLDIEIMLLHVPLFLLILVYALNYIAWPLFLLLFYMIEIRIFIANHDRFHTDRRQRLPRPVEAFSEWLSASVTPWDEPYDSILKKHLTHHSTHAPGKSVKHDPLADPHSLFETGGFWSALFHCLFYEESQLIIDFRNGNIGRERWIHLMTYLPLQALFIYGFGWEKYLIVFLSMRMVGCTAWFIFSWGIHQPFVYRFGFSRQVPKWFRFIFAVLNGNRVTEGVIHHATHHAWPGIPSKRLHEFDELVLRYPEAAPEMQTVN